MIFKMLYPTLVVNFKFLLLKKHCGKLCRVSFDPYFPVFELRKNEDFMIQIKCSIFT